MSMGGWIAESGPTKTGYFIVKFNRNWNQKE